jgi:receptor protein-tyrosine kinase
MNSRLERFVERMDGDLYLAFQEALRRAHGSGAQGTGNTTVVTSASGREGKTHVALSLAAQAATIGRQKTLVVDAAAQRRGCATWILSGRRPRSGGVSSPADSLRTATDLPLLDLLTWGPRVVGPEGSPAMESLADVLSRLRPEYDLIVIDAVSMCDGPGALGLLRCADRILFVVEHRRRSAGQIRSYIARIDTPQILGVVLNKRRYPIPQLIYDHL